MLPWIYCLVKNIKKGDCVDNISYSSNRFTFKLLHKQINYIVGALNKP